MRKFNEFELQKQIAQYLRTAYKDVMFLSDVRASLKLTIPQQVRAKKLQAESFACPDMIIFFPSQGHHAMFLEFKADSPYKLNGELKRSDHLDAQWKAILRLRKLGYHADFYWSVDTAMATIKAYLKW